PLPFYISFLIFFPFWFLESMVSNSLYVYSAGGIRNPIGLTPLGWVITILYSYFITCVIVWVYYFLTSK
ncbi:MAG: hypothetical protein QW321_02145, partial [Candidatus Aenigmatarchaeota archaeon]